MTPSAHREPHSTAPAAAAGPARAEVRQLRSCLNQLVSIQALAQAWYGERPSRIAETLAEVLLQMLDLDLAGVGLEESKVQARFEAIRAAKGRPDTRRTAEAAESLAGWLRSGSLRVPSSNVTAFGEGKVFILPLNAGLEIEAGFLAAYSERATFPTDTERLLLNVARNQAVIALHDSWRLCEQIQLADDLDRRVTEGAKELAQEIETRERAEVSLRASEGRWKGVFENSAVGIALTDLAGRFELTNSAFQSLVGYSEQELRNLGFCDLMPAESASRKRTLLADMRQRARQHCEMEEQYRSKDGSLVWVRNHISLVPGADGAPQYVMAIVENILPRKRAEEELQQLVDFVPQIIVVLEPDGRWILANRVAQEYTGLKVERYRFEDAIRVVIHPEDAERVRRSRHRGLTEGTPFEIEARMRRHDGQYRWFLFRYNPLIEQGAVRRWYATATEIEDRKREEERVQEENLALRAEIAQISMSDEIVGASPALRGVLARVSKVAPTGSTVLILGETGTGKELIARAIHRLSAQVQGPFVNVNCAAIPRDLIASELFGHEKGAFTGATQRRLGRFELAQGGTLFLDEIAELPLETQSVLLRVLQEREFERVGGSGAIRADVRVIAATNRHLESTVASGAFRSDLFYRLNVFPIELPPLRDRRQDIPMLVEYFIDRFARKAGKSIKPVSKKSLDRLQQYAWPGNVRELQNIVERSVIVSEAEEFTVDESWLSASGAEAEKRTELGDELAAHEKEIIEAALRESRGRVYGPSGAAVKLGVPRSTLESRIRALKINKYGFKR